MVGKWDGCLTPGPFMCGRILSVALVGVPAQFEPPAYQPTRAAMAPYGARTGMTPVGRKLTIVSGSHPSHRRGRTLHAADPLLVWSSISHSLPYAISVAGFLSPARSRWCGLLRGQYFLAGLFLV